MPSSNLRISSTLLLALSCTQGDSGEVTQVHIPLATLTFTASADARVAAAKPSTNYGTSSSLKMDGSPAEWSYLRFAVSGITEPVQSAKLRIYVTNSTSDGPAVFSTTSGWTERGITWNNRPAAQGTVLDNEAFVPSGAYVEYDVAAAVQADGSYDFVLIPESSDGMDGRSREASSSRPQLVVTVGSASGADAAVADATVDAPAVDAPTVDAPTPDAPTVDAAVDAPTVDAPVDAPTAEPVVLVGAGDISSCSTSGDSTTAAMLDNIPGTVFTLGDNVYDTGTAAEFANCYDPTWGRHKARTLFPVVGNHEYESSSTASGYAGYFGAAAGAVGQYYYSRDLGSWHIIVLNSELCSSGGCNSAMMSWLAADLAQHAGKRCTLAMWHRPRFSSGRQSSDANMAPMFQALYDANADVVLVSHSHTYERFLPQNPSAQLDTARGIVQFVVGTGGSDHHSISTIKPNSAVRNADTFGLLKLTLRDGAYDFQFLPQPGKSFTDTGSGSCH